MFHCQGFGWQAIRLPVEAFGLWRRLPAVAAEACEGDQRRRAFSLSTGVANSTFGRL
jgi:hypothetical protein